MATKLKTRSFDAAEHLDSEEAQREYLAAAVESNDPAFIADAIGVVARARGMTDIANRTGVSRQQLYRSLSASGNPTLATLTKVLDAMGLKLSVV
ncbi:addiction module antidote protein [Sphingomonas sp.]|uniref:addiction module antidote protein n=1 Tax=Sphingomonas sp. TaxID=28214 RepID=UPI002ED7C2C0